jgi:hypothetical protein
MKTILRASLAWGLLLSTAGALAYSIPEEQLDKQKVYYGVSRSKDFEKPAEVQYEQVVRATREFKEIKKKKIERGTGKYWILLSQASDRAVRAIAEVGDETEYDLIAAHGYLGSLNPAVPAVDITKDVIEVVEEESK